MELPESQRKWNSGHKLSIEVEAQPVPQETTNNHKKQAQQGNCQRTKKGESSRLPKNEPLTGTLERRHQPQYQPYRIGAETREGRYLGEQILWLDWWYLLCGHSAGVVSGPLGPVVLHQLQHKEDTYRAAHPSWMDQEEAPVDIKKQWQEARANRRMQFKVGNYRDGDKESNIRMLTGPIKADWIQLPVERYLAALPTLRQGVIAGVFRPLCGLTCPCWAMTFTTYGRSMTA